MLKIFLMWTIYKVFIEFVTILLLFYVLGYMGSQLLDQGLNLILSELEGEIPTPGFLVHHRLLDLVQTHGP